MSAVEPGSARPLEGRVAVVTGAAQGIGAATARALTAAGATVYGADVAPVKLADVRGERCDVTSEADLVRLAGVVRDEHGAADIVVANAGIGVGADTLTMPVEDWDRMMAVDLRGVWLTCRAFLPDMIERRRGALIAVASQLGLVGFPTLAAYTAAKGGVINLVRTMAAEYGAHGIRVNALCPGPTLTEALAGFIDSQPDPAAVRARFESSVLLGRLAEPDEIAQAALFLAGDASSFVTGSALVVDGGYMAV